MGSWGKKKRVLGFLPLVSPLLFQWDVRKRSAPCSTWGERSGRRGDVSAPKRQNFPQIPPGGLGAPLLLPCSPSSRALQPLASTGLGSPRPGGGPLGAASLQLRGALPENEPQNQKKKKPKRGKKMKRKVSKLPFPR